MILKIAVILAFAEVISGNQTREVCRFSCQLPMVRSRFSGIEQDNMWRPSASVSSSCGDTNCETIITDGISSQLRIFTDVNGFFVHGVDYYGNILDMVTYGSSNGEVQFRPRSQGN